MTSQSTEPRASRRRAGRHLALTGGAGVGALVAGIALGIVAYDKKYFPEGDLAARLQGETTEPSPLWEAVSLIGFLLTLGGTLAIAFALVGFVILGAVRLVQAAGR